MNSDELDENELCGTSNKFLKTIEVPTAYDLYPKSLFETSNGDYIITGAYSVLRPLAVVDFFEFTLKTDKNGNEIWRKSFNTENNHAVGWGAIEDKGGGYISVGEYYKTFYSDEGFMIKRDTEGLLLWEKKFSSHERDLLATINYSSDGGYILLGKLAANSELGVGCLQLIHTDKVGNVTWQKNLRSYNDDLASTKSLDVSIDGGYIISGLSKYIHGEKNDNNLHIMKVNSNEALEWQKSFLNDHTSIFRSSKVIQIEDEGYIVMGQTEEIPIEETDIQLKKLDQNGELIWEKTIFESGYETGKALLAEEDNTFLVMGSISDQDFDDTGILLLKLDEEGEIIWKQEYLRDFDVSGMNITKTKDGGYMLTGVSGGELFLVKTDFEVSKELMNYQGIKTSYEKIRQVSLSLGEQCLSQRSSIQLASGESLAGKRVVIAMDGGRSRTRVYQEGKVGRAEKFDTPWREPKLFVISTIDDQGKLNKIDKPIYDGTFGDDETFELLEGYLRSCFKSYPNLRIRTGNIAK